MNMNARATLVKPSTIRIERLLPGPVERVWAYLTHVGILADQLNGVKPRPFWATHDRLMKEFEAAL